MRCQHAVAEGIERCPRCAQLRLTPLALPLLRRPGANWALCAIMLGLLGAISWGVLAALALPILCLAWRSSSSEQARPLCHGVRSLVGIGLLAVVLGMGVGLWSFFSLRSSAMVQRPHSSLVNR